MSEELKACECGRPFNEPGVIDTERTPTMYRVRCCACPASTAHYARRADAIAAWNDRALPSRVDVARAICPTCQKDHDGKCPDPVCPSALAAADAVLRLLGET